MRLSNAGFTYIGLLIIIAILSIVATTTVSIGALAQRRQAEEELLTIGLAFQQALISYYNATPNGQPRHPARLEDLLKDPRYPNIKRHLRKIYMDPMTGKAEWGLIEIQGGIIGIHSLSTAKPIKVGLFPGELANLNSKNKYAEWIFGIPIEYSTSQIPRQRTLSPSSH